MLLRGCRLCRCLLLPSRRRGGSCLLCPVWRCCSCPGAPCCCNWLLRCCISCKFCTGLAIRCHNCCLLGTIPAASRLLLLPWAACCRRRWRSCGCLLLIYLLLLLCLCQRWRQGRLPPLFIEGSIHGLHLVPLPCIYCWLCCCWLCCCCCCWWW